MDTTPGESGRPLTDRERAVVDGFLSFDFPGVEEFRVQASTARAGSSCTCGCGTIALFVDRMAPASSRISWSPIEAEVVDDLGGVIGGLLLFTNDGYLDGLEIYSFLDEPLQLPPIDRVRWSYLES
ncbi:hypothetical protein [Tsukamurella paurometabola]|uniref:Uncharacterized protein n=1 Tax=Tsukamurella paurometabola TaxID=2061 RepID=A0ABS5NDY1_TSUPA|nr:hypothetical protein [Tsukamurella paurometabola]MBS4102485.1 hypothetical protein [Tsukamurella paurometabola]